MAAQPFVHPGLLQSRHDLDFIRGKVDAGEQPWKQAWENLLQTAGFRAGLSAETHRTHRARLIPAGRPSATETFRTE
jgi:hypothetical protein